MKKTLIACALSLAALGCAQAQTTVPAANPLHYVLGIGYTSGGDKLATAYYTDGNSANIRAGQGLLLQAGLEYRVLPEMSIQGTIGYHDDSANATNGHADFTRVPLELMAYYHVNAQWRVGGGARYVSSAKLHGSGFANGLDMSFQDTTGAVMEAEYFVNPKFSVKVRAVKESYKLADYDYKVNGDHIGVLAAWYF
jgi:opacity protein-like surface antigen